MPFLCEECGITGARIIFGIDIRLCKDCKQLFKYRMISKTHALKDYGLKYEEIENLEYKEVGNPLYRGERNMKLYKERDVLNIFINKYYKIINDEDMIILNSQEDNSQFYLRICDIINKTLVFYKENKNIKLEKKLFN